MDYSSAWRQKGLTGYCFKYMIYPFASELTNCVLVIWYTAMAVVIASFISQKNHSSHPSPRLITAAWCLYWIGKWDVVSTYKRHLAFEVMFTCSTLIQHCCCDLPKWLLKCFRSVPSMVSNATEGCVFPEPTYFMENRQNVVNIIDNTRCNTLTFNIIYHRIVTTSEIYSMNGSENRIQYPTYTSWDIRLILHLLRYLTVVLPGNCSCCDTSDI